jgi:hypothetical protein
LGYKIEKKMHQQLKEKLWAYIVQNNPELMFTLQEDYSVTQYLEDRISEVMPTALKLLAEDKPGYAIIELCMEELTTPLRPSKFNYLTAILATEFEEIYANLKESGLLTYEAVNLIDYCQPHFEKYGFSEANEDSSLIRGAIKDAVSTYLKEL